MSSFICQECNKPIVDTPQGYVTECEHWPLPLPAWKREDAPRAAEAGEDKELAAGVLRLTGTIRYLVGIAERGEGRSIRHDETVESFVLHYVQRLEQGRPAIIAECARELTSYGERAAASIVRALAPGGQNAATQVISGDQGACQQDGPRQVPPAVAAPDELRKAYFEGYEDALKDRSAPAEVAEGAGEDTLTAEERRIAQIYASARDSYPGHQESAGTLARACLRLERALRAAPSLSREEWQILSAALAVYAMGDANLTALRAKVREQEREGKDG
jgi:hypothetical protein